MQRIPFALMLALAAACEMSPVAIEAPDAGSVGGLRAGPAQRVWLDLVRDLGRPGVPAELPGLDSLFVLALEGQPAEMAATARAGHRELLDTAWAAIDRGDLDAGERGLLAARAFQAGTVVRAFGPGASVAYTALVSRTIERLRESLAANGVVPRLDAMTLTARDLVADARLALDGGDPESALDLSAHAAGLTNLVARELRDR